MELQISEIKQSDLEVNFVPEIENEFQETENSLQRTEEWQQERKGNWTGSQFKQIMTCSSKGGRLDWFNKDKVFFFSEGALKYIFRRRRLPLRPADRT